MRGKQTNFRCLQYVDEVIIGAPYSVTEDVLNKEYNVSIVVHGNTLTELDLDGSDPYKVSSFKKEKTEKSEKKTNTCVQLAKERGVYVEIENPNNTITTQGIIERIIENRFM